MEMKISEGLAAARRALLHFGWCQGTSQSVSGRLCALAAICFATENEKAEKTQKGFICSVRDAMQRYLGQHDIPGWNDDKSRTLEEVLAAFEGAEVIERMMESAGIERKVTPRTTWVMPDFEFEIQISPIQMTGVTSLVTTAQQTVRDMLQGLMVTYAIDADEATEFAKFKLKPKAQADPHHCEALLCGT